MVQCSHSLLLNAACLISMLLLHDLPTVESCFGGLGGLGGLGGGCCCRPMCFQAAARAASARTLDFGRRHNHTTATISIKQKILDDDAAFTTCCRSMNLPTVCIDKCTYATYTKEALNAMLFKQDACPIETANMLHYCAAKGADHRECCSRNGVATTIAGEKCLVFCDQRVTDEDDDGMSNATKQQQQQPQLIDFTYLPCYERFDQMRSCFLFSDQQQQDESMVDSNMISH